MNEIEDKEGIFRIIWASQDQNLERCNRNGKGCIDAKDILMVES